MLIEAPLAGADGAAAPETCWPPNTLPSSATAFFAIRVNKIGGTVTIAGVICSPRSRAALTRVRLRPMT